MATVIELVTLDWRETSVAAWFWSELAARAQAIYLSSQNLSFLIHNIQGLD
jgi:hypothetical protein